MPGGALPIRVSFSTQERSAINKKIVEALHLLVHISISIHYELENSTLYVGSRSFGHYNGPSRAAPMQTPAVCLTLTPTRARSPRSSAVTYASPRVLQHQGVLVSSITSFPIPNSVVYAPSDSIQLHEIWYQDHRKPATQQSRDG